MTSLHQVDIEKLSNQFLRLQKGFLETITTTTNQKANVKVLDKKCELLEEQLNVCKRDKEFLESQIKSYKETLDQRRSFEDENKKLKSELRQQKILVENLKEDISTKTKEYEQQLEDQKLDHVTEIAEINKKHTDELETEQAKYELELLDKRTEIHRLTESMETLRLGKDSEIERLKFEFNEKMKHVQQQHQQRVQQQQQKNSQAQSAQEMYRQRLQHMQQEYEREITQLRNQIQVQNSNYNAANSTSFRTARGQPIIPTRVNQGNNRTNLAQSVSSVTNTNQTAEPQPSHINQSRNSLKKRKLFTSDQMYDQDSF